MSSDNQYTALGPAIIGFQTSATEIDIGADIEGRDFGVKGRSEKGTGVHGECTTKDPRARKSREFGSGVVGSSAFGAGVYGETTHSGRGGKFSSKNDAVPQLQLVPHLMRVPAKKPASPEMFIPEVFDRLTEDGVGGLPKEGQGGDLLVTQDDRGFCTLWFCVQGMDGKHPAAQWSEVLLGTPIFGRAEIKEVHDL